MRIFNKVENFPPDPKQPLVLSLGNFDGLHLGHQSILGRTVKDAAKSGGRSAVFTFQQHPQSVLNPAARPKLLTSIEHKLYLFSKTGIEICFMLPFTEEFSRLEAGAFVRDILVEKLKVKKVILGYSTRFGHERKGDSQFMKKAAAEYGFEFEEVPAVKAAGDAVSSSRIRKLISAGDLDQAAACLGRSFSILGKVVKGDGRGRTIGFPTANLETGSEILPPAGVYTVYVKVLDLHKPVEGEDFSVNPLTAEPGMPGVLNYGVRPTFNGEGSLPVIEVHLLDFQGNLYGKMTEVVFIKRLRDEKRFSGKEELVRQIESDIIAARQAFNCPK